jgi:hypothetical protein
MLIIIPAILIFSFLIWALTRPDSGSSPYEKSRNFMDFDPGKDGKKVGDPKYPTAGADSVMKHEFMNDLFDDKSP